MATEKVWDCIIIGGGPAGYSAGIYAVRANMKVLCIAGEKAGGQLMLTTDVEDYPGFKKIQGPELMKLMREHTEGLGVEIINEDVTKVDFKNKSLEIFVGKQKFLAKVVIIATGASPKLLGIPSEKRLFAKGVSTCAVCDGFFFKGKPLAVIGGGDTAMREALYLAKLGCKVTVVHRRDKLKAQPVLANRAFQNPNIKFLWNSVVDEILGKDKVEGVRVKDVNTGKTAELKLNAVFVAIGHKPNTDFLKGQIKLDDHGYIALKNETGTSVGGVFAAGDVHDYRYMQAVTAAGAGCKAALDAHAYLEEKLPIQPESKKAKKT